MLIGLAVHASICGPDLVRALANAVFQALIHLKRPDLADDDPEIVAKLRQVDVLVSRGQPMADAIRQIGVSEVTYYRWRQEFGGLKTEQVKRLKDLELENSRLQLNRS
jgi:Transposase